MKFFEFAIFDSKMNFNVTDRDAVPKQLNRSSPLQLNMLDALPS